VDAVLAAVKKTCEDREMIRITGYIEKDPETGLYVAVVPGIPGAHTQAETLDELQQNLKEVVELCLEEMDEEARRQIPQFIGIQQLEVAG
jgi:predicted RNase H-like HicB family nuclease